VEVATRAFDQTAVILDEMLMAVTPLALGDLLALVDAFQYGRLDVQPIAPQVAVIVRAEELGEARWLLCAPGGGRRIVAPLVHRPAETFQVLDPSGDAPFFFPLLLGPAMDLRLRAVRSEERRVGKECRSR